MLYFLQSKRQGEGEKDRAREKERVCVRERAKTYTILARMRCEEKRRVDEERRDRDKEMVKVENHLRLEKNRFVLGQGGVRGWDG